MDRPEFPRETIRRLPLYLRCLNRLLILGKDTLTSKELSEFLGVKPAQIRKDFSYFGDFGTRGVGYDLENLVKEIRKILNLEEEWELAIAGIGNIGDSILDHIEFNQPGFRFAAAFDQQPDLVGSTIRGNRVHELSEIEEVLEGLDVRIAVLAVPAIDARNVADSLANAGVKGIINLAPIFLNPPEDVKVAQMDLSSELGQLVYNLEED
ncbi:redox-sensing transcriptional repressor Rex [Candidatus Bipolaricaulota bacterium]|nr:redox-sensing transcriptional repressor Rex [Candidatus Bipolaricaulota bacterium]